MPPLTSTHPKVFRLYESILAIFVHHLPGCWQPSRSPLKAGCSNLHEVNFVSENESHELDCLTQLVAQNLSLCTMSIKGFRTMSRRGCNRFEKFKAFVVFPDNYPQITCLYMEGGLHWTQDNLQALLEK